MLVAAVFMMWAPSGAIVELVALGLQSGVLILAMRVADAPRRMARLATVVAVAILVVAAGVEAAASSRQQALIVVLAALLVMGAMVAIVAELSGLGTIDRRTVLGAVCLYLLLGTLFAYVFAAVSALDGDPFFADGTTPSLATFQYFSFTTLTTLGYGDLAPATQLGRSLAIAEALLGQIYLVTVVALLVGNLHLPGERRGRAPGRGDRDTGGGGQRATD